MKDPEPAPAGGEAPPPVVSLSSSPLAPRGCLAPCRLGDSALRRGPGRGGGEGQLPRGAYRSEGSRTAEAAALHWQACRPRHPLSPHGSAGLPHAACVLPAVVAAGRRRRWVAAAASQAVSHCRRVRFEGRLDSVRGQCLAPLPRAAPAKEPHGCNCWKAACKRGWKRPEIGWALRGSGLRGWFGAVWRGSLSPGGAPAPWAGGWVLQPSNQGARQCGGAEEMHPSHAALLRSPGTAFIPDRTVPLFPLAPIGKSAVSAAPGPVQVRSRAPRPCPAPQAQGSLESSSKRS